MTWKNRITGLTMEDPEDLCAHPMNARQHPGAQRNALRGSLDDVGWIDAVIVNDISGFVVDGHCRVEEAISAGEPTIPVLHVELTDNEEAEMLALFDPISAMARYDKDRLEDLAAIVDTDNTHLQELLDSLKATAPEMPESDDDVSIFGDETEFRSVLLLYSAEKYDEFQSLMDDLPGSSPAEKVLNALRQGGLVG